MKKVPTQSTDVPAVAVFIGALMLVGVIGIAVAMFTIPRPSPAHVDSITLFHDPFDVKVPASLYYDQRECVARLQVDSTTIRVPLPTEACTAYTLKDADRQKEPDVVQFYDSATLHYRDNIVISHPVAPTVTDPHGTVVTPR